MPELLTFWAVHQIAGGRKVVRLKNEAVKQRLEAQYQELSSQQLYARRKASVEHPFGT